MERNEKLRVFFAQNSSSIIDAVPESELEIVIDYYNNNQKPIDVLATFSAPNLINLNRKQIKIDDIPPRRPKANSIKFTTPTKFQTINIRVLVEEKVGILSQTRGEPIMANLTVRLLRQKALKTTRSPEVDKHLEELAELDEPLIFVLDNEKMIGITPVVGDLNTNPSIAFTMPSTIEIPIQWNVDARSLNNIIVNAQEAVNVLERVAEDQQTLRYFVGKFRDFFIEQGATVSVEGDLHLLVKPAPVYAYYATQVSPLEDEFVGKKIADLAEMAKKENWFFSVLTTKIDSSLISISQTHNIHVVNVFNGVMIKAGWRSEPNIEDFIENKLGLELQIFDGVGDAIGKYTANTFRERLGGLD